MSNWEDAGILIFRNLINDVVEPYTYADCRLKSLLITAAYLNIQYLDFDISYTIDLLHQEIEPDPTDNGFLSLMVLKAVAMLAESEWKTDARKGMIVKDGPSSIDMTDMLDAKKAYAEKTADALNRAVTTYRTGNYNPGRAIVGAARFDLQPIVYNMFY